MTRKTLQTVLVASMVLLAGCAGGLSGSPTTAPGGDDDGGAGDSGTVALYISDQPNAIGDFEHLNVTISQVGFHQSAEDEDDDSETDADAAGNETDAADTATDVNETDSGVTATESNETDGDDTATDANETDAESDDESGGWIEHDADNRTVDLTTLLGHNATMLDEFDLPNGTYNKVFVHVSDVNATLENGETVNVKLPSDKLHINKPFRIGNGESVDFVFDIAVHEAGASGKYILRPVIGESGTDVPIKNADDDRDEMDGDDALNATFVGDVEPGENATVAVTNESGPVANATVTVNGEQVGETDDAGRLTFAVPDGEELAVEIGHGDAETELEREFEAEDGDDPADAAGTPTPTAGS